MRTGVAIDFDNPCTGFHSDDIRIADGSSISARVALPSPRFCILLIPSTCFPLQLSASFGRLPTGTELHDELFLLAGHGCTMGG